MNLESQTFSSDKKCVWIIEDDPGSQFVYSEILGRRYALSFFDTLGDFRSILKTQFLNKPDLLIADLRLPDDSFLTFLNCPVEKKQLIFPFVVVSSIDDVHSLRLCFKKGAQDYLTKPFGRAELQVKVEKILKQKIGANVPQSTLELDATTMTLLYENRRSKVLTSKEVQIISALQQADSNSVKRDDLIALIWKDVNVTPKAFDVHLFHLRKKIVNLGLEIAYKAPYYRLIYLPKPLEFILPKE